MSFGNLNILMHKKWHVWRAENLEKVLKDEKEHREQLAREHTQQVQRVPAPLLRSSLPSPSIHFFLN